MDACLPDEILTDILVRHPPKFLGRCKCVSKRWNALISDPEFIKTNFSLNTRRGRNKVLYLAVAASAAIRQSLAIPDAFVSFPKLQIGENQLWYRIVGSCNGLVLAQDFKHNLFLLNPTTRAYKIVPILPWDTLTGATIGLGYDSIADDYKVVAITLGHTVFIYTSKSGYWKVVWDCPISRTVENINYENINYVGFRVFLNASIHWLHDDSNVSFITAFDLTTEEFRKVPLPQAVGRSSTSYLDVVGGCLCLLSNNACRSGPAAGEFDIWVMVEYGVEESWTKFSVNLLQPVVQPQGGFVGDHLEELVLIDKWYNNVWSYDANKGTWRNLNDRRWPIYVCTFVDSLISP